MIVFTVKFAGCTCHSFLKYSEIVLFCSTLINTLHDWFLYPRGFKSSLPLSVVKFSEHPEIICYVWVRCIGNIENAQPDTSYSSLNPLFLVFTVFDVDSTNFIADPWIYIGKLDTCPQSTYRKNDGNCWKFKKSLLLIKIP
jgi:hypothetical protein